MHPHLATPGRRATPGLRRAVLAVVITFLVVVVRQLVDALLRAGVPTWSTQTTMFVEMLALAGVYGALAWFFVVVPARRRPAPPVHPEHLRTSVRSTSAPTLVRVPAARPRHLTLVPSIPQR
jgi:hypothetical protein